MWESKLDWTFDVVDGAFCERDLRDRTAHVFAVAPSKILAFGKGEPFSQTRYRF